MNVDAACQNGPSGSPEVRLSLTWMPEELPTASFKFQIKAGQGVGQAMNANGFLHKTIKMQRRIELEKQRLEVMVGKLNADRVGNTKKDLMYNKKGKVVTKRQHANGMNLNAKVRALQNGIEEVN